MVRPPDAPGDPPDPTGPPAEAAGEGAPEPGPKESGADRVAREMRERSAAHASPAPTEQDREMFASLLGYHLGKGTIDADEFSRRMEEVWAATSLTALYRLTADLPFPPPLAHLSSSEAPRRRRWWRR